MNETGWAGMSRKANRAVRRGALAMGALIAVVLAGCSGEEESDALGTAPRPVIDPAAPAPAVVASSVDRDALRARASAIFGALPAEAANPDNPITSAKVELGRILYYDPRLSKNHDVSCNTCHLLDRGGVDGEPTSTGHRGQRGARNAPSVYNAALHIAQFWDGRAPDVEAQALGPVLNPIEMGMADGNAVLGVIRTIPGYVDAFTAALVQLQPLMSVAPGPGLFFFAAVVVLTMLAVVTVAIVSQRSLFGVVILAGIYSFLMASLLIVLDAVDVAMTEASVGAGISTGQFLPTAVLAGFAGGWLLLAAHVFYERENRT